LFKYVKYQLLPIIYCIFGKYKNKIQSTLIFCSYRGEISGSEGKHSSPGEIKTIKPECNSLAEQTNLQGFAATPDVA